MDATSFGRAVRRGATGYSLILNHLHLIRVCCTSAAVALHELKAIDETDEQRQIRQDQIRSILALDELTKRKLQTDLDHIAIKALFKLWQECEAKTSILLKQYHITT